jgi:hypothetical protein
VVTTTGFRLVNKYKISEGILKMDCEGCEYASIIGATNDTLRRFKQIQIEYHYGPKELVQKLSRAGFETTIEGLYRATNKMEKKPMYIGYIYGFRKNETNVGEFS